MEKSESQHDSPNPEDERPMTETPNHADTVQTETIPTIGSTENNPQPIEQTVEVHVENMSEEELDEMSEMSVGAEEITRVRESIKRNPNRIKGFSKYLNLLETRLMALEKKILPAPPPEEVKPPEPAKHEASIPKLRLVKWTDFKHRYADEKITYAIEVLIGPAQFWADRAKVERLHGNFNIRLPLHVPEQVVPVTDEDVAALDDMPERIRINSLQILAVLNRMANETGDGMPRVLLRPYKRLLYFESQIRQKLADLQKKWSPTILEIEHTDEAPTSDTIELGGGQTKPIQDDLSSIETMNDLQCLVDFLDKFVKPHLGRFDGITKGKAKFQDLWQLFKPGETIYMPIKIAESSMEKDMLSEKKLFGLSNHAATKGSKRTQTAYNVICVMGGRAELQGRDNEDDWVSAKLYFTPFFISLFYVDFNGKEFLPFTLRLKIDPFEGEREIMSLPFYPWRFAENADRMSEQLFHRGHDFLNYTKTQHRFYVGTTLAMSPSGYSVGDPFIESPEHIEGDVIVDFGQTFQSLPGWSPVPFEYELFGIPNEFNEDYDTMVWDSQDHKNIVSMCNDIIDKDWVIECRRMEDYIRLVPIFKFKQSEEADSYDGTKLAEDLIILLPERVFGYHLLDRKFCQLSIENLRPVPDKQDGFDNLKLFGKTKSVVRALVSAHFMKTKITNTSINEVVDYDIVRGKGRGLILLLHGVPGVGKTSTAETVAQSLRKPLLPIVCGDIGTTPEKVEKSLTEIFRLAQHWDCVLLLDEADVFLAQRTERDLEQNALVSVFLRKLEWFSGILFLTTNRVGVIDEAFMSRIHMALYYPPLSLSQTKKIWRMNLERIRRIDDARIKGTNNPPMAVDENNINLYAEAYYEQNRWNGRQIRNAFQTATAIALHRAQGENETRKKTDPSAALVAPRLEKEDFDIVSKAILQFRDYMAAVNSGYDESEMAWRHGNRADHHTYTTSPPAPKKQWYDNPAQNKNPSQRSPYSPSPAAANPRTPQSYAYDRQPSSRMDFGASIPGMPGAFQPGLSHLSHTHESAQMWEGFGSTSFTQSQQQHSPSPQPPQGQPLNVWQASTLQDEDEDKDED